MYSSKKSSSSGIDRKPANVSNGIAPSKTSTKTYGSTRNSSHQQLEHGSASKRSPSLSSVATALRRTSLEIKPQSGSSTISTGVFKPAPPVPALGKPRDSRARPKLDLPLNEPPPHSSMEPSSSASSKTEAITSPFTRDPVPCKKPACHPGSSDFQAPVNDFFLQKSWIKGPSDPSGTAVSLSDRPSLCMSVHGSELAVGSSDHAVYTIDVGTCGLTRIMHGKSHGHTEWVTCLDHFKSGTFDAGSQSTLLVSTGPACIAVTKNTTCGCPLVATAGADRVLKVLDVRASFNAVFTLEDHRDFIYSLEETKTGSLAWSGGGDGSLLVHDVERGKCLYGLGAIKNGAVRGVSLAGDVQEKLVVTGDDGNVMIYSL